MARFLSRMAVIAAAIALLALFAGCGSTTLEKYFADHQDQWNQVVEQMADMGGDAFTTDISVEGNQVNQITTYTDTFEGDSVKDMHDYFQDQLPTIAEQITTTIETFEEESGVTGITWHIQFLNGDGTEIFSASIDEEGTVTTTTDATAQSTTENANPNTPETSSAE